MKSEWISVKDRLPNPEERVLVCAESRCAGKVYKYVAAAMHEDGAVLVEDSGWNFEDFDGLIYDGEKDVWKIPEGWWECAIYNDEQTNCPVSDVVTHWMPLPQPPVEESGDREELGRGKER